MQCDESSNKLSNPSGLHPVHFSGTCLHVAGKNLIKVKLLILLVFTVAEGLLLYFNL